MAADPPRNKSAFGAAAAPKFVIGETEKATGGRQKQQLSPPNHQRVRKKRLLTAGEEEEKHGEESAHIKRRGSSSYPHNHPSSSGKHFPPLPGQTRIREEQNELKTLSLS